jgi:predicted PurR-regulated permease PerM
MQLNTNKRSFTIAVIVAGIIITASILIYTLRFFIDAFLGAVIFYVLFRKLVVYLERKGWKRGLAAVLIILLTFIIVIVPIITALDLIIPRIMLFFNEGSITMNAVRELDKQISNATGIQFLSEDNVRKLQTEAAVFITDFFSTGIGIISSLILMYFVLYYMLVSTGRMENTILQYLPMNATIVKRFTDELEMQTFSNAIGAPLLALIQGMVAALGYWLFGIDEPLFWGIMTGFFSFLPVVGTAAIWAPAAIFQYTSGFHWQGAAIFLYGIFVIGLLDNVLRFVFQKRFADVHPLVTVIGVIAGLSLFGIPGIIFGPLLISYFILLMKIFSEELQARKSQPSLIQSEEK